MTACSMKSGAGPWRRRDLLMVAGAQLAGFGLLGLAWVGTSGTTKFSEQVSWLNVGIVGLLAVHLGGALWVYRGRREVALRLGSGELGGLVERPGVAGAPTAASEAVTVTVTGMTHYHRPDCQAVRGKAVTPASPSSELEPCGMCEP